MNFRHGHVRCSAVARIQRMYVGIGGGGKEWNGVMGMDGWVEREGGGGV